MIDTLSGIKYEETTVKSISNTTGISGKSISQRLQNWWYISILAIFTSGLRNYQR
jgi:hypothetical protein